jgi:hypothetical protein
MASFCCVHKRPGSLGEEPDFGVVDPVVFVATNPVQISSRPPFFYATFKSHLGGFQKKGDGGWG